MPASDMAHDERHAESGCRNERREQDYRDPEPTFGWCHVQLQTRDKTLSEIRDLDESFDLGSEVALCGQSLGEEWKREAECLHDAAMEENRSEAKR